MTSVAIVGAGISGLVAAHRLRRLLGENARIVIVDSAERIGGKLRTVDMGSGPVDVGAEAFIARRPEVPELLAELGLSDELVRPSSTARPLLRTGGALHSLPVGTLMGIPATSESVRSIVDDETCRRIDDERSRPLAWTPGDDAAVGALVSERFGPLVTARSVDPLLGGVYSGLSDTTSVRAALPTLAAALDGGASSLGEAVERARPTPAPGPVFGGLRRGYGVLLEALLASSRADQVHADVADLTRDSGGQWVIPGVGAVDGVLLAVPAPVASGLLVGVDRALGTELGALPLASSAVVALGYDACDLPENSGVLVATGELDSTGVPLRAKAFTLSSRKWPHLAERGGELVRVSFGRFGDSAIVDRPDDVLIDAARRDLQDVLGITDVPTTAFVQRWHGGLPQYRPGHVARIARIDAAAAAISRLELAGAYLHGVGVPACVATASAAALRLAAAL
ncbi:protoporphyrinogen oxidase [Rhodococcus sp. MEB064]|uniref:protoporphyrinogen oxidase n=1 Tax=Rhodococcus sp. MEB064 TaxID=1587522 RepID=UPI0005ACCCCC|nr:protoporphyrinogen oxidase [Rhodococcus sp. MEB064]KIQ20725.1 protoporphyrinogen oxidase [Rhodococcus sp. MEB064]